MEVYLTPYPKILGGNNGGDVIKYSTSQVYSENQLLVNISSRSPRLTARGLPSGRTLYLRIYASSSKGRSKSIRVNGYTLRMADKHPGKQ